MGPTASKIAVIVSSASAVVSDPADATSCVLAPWPRRSSRAAVAPAAPAAAAAAGRRPFAARRRLRRRAAAGRVGPGGLSIAPVLRGAGQHVARRTADLPLLHPAEAQPAVAGHLGALRRRRPRRPSAKTSAGSGTPTSSTTCRSTTSDYTFPNGVIGKMSPTTWRSGSASRSSTTGLEEDRDRRRSTRS